MTITRRNMFALAAGAGLVAASGTRIDALAAGAEPEVADDGLYKQPWFHQSFLDLRDDITEASDAGKQFVILFEQRGCPYCKETHKVNLAHPETVKYITENFNLLQLDLWGPRRVTDFDGEEMGERELAQRWRVNFTPTLVFFPRDAKEVLGKPGREGEAWRLVGYWKPFHFLSTFEFVRSGEYKTTNFQRFLQAKAERLRAQGKKVELW